MGPSPTKSMMHVVEGGPPALLELDTLNMVASFQLPTSAGMLRRDEFAVMRRLTDCWSDSMDGCFGSSTLSQARTLLASGGRCTGCEGQLDLTGPEASERGTLPHRQPARAR
jgi:hypothetical protein